MTFMKAWLSTSAQGMQLRVEARNDNHRDMLRKFYYDAREKGLVAIGSGDGGGATVIHIEAPKRKKR